MAAGPSILLLPPNGFVVIDAESAVDTVGVLPSVMCGKQVETTFYVCFDETASAGQVVIESAGSRNYAGTWVDEGTVDCVDDTKAHRVSLTLLSGAMRARITTEIADGTITVYAMAATNS